MAASRALSKPLSLRDLKRHLTWFYGTSHQYYLNRKVWFLSMNQAAPCGMMSSAPADVRSLDGLRNFINLALCQKENLLENHFPMTELELTRGGDCCGYQFTLHGPRSVKLSAVWDRKGNEVLFYDAVGKRFARTRLPHDVI